MHIIFYHFVIPFKQCIRKFMNIQDLMCVALSTRKELASSLYVNHALQSRSDRHCIHLKGGTCDFEGTIFYRKMFFEICIKYIDDVTRRLHARI